jgi:hypothetical protein
MKSNSIQGKLPVVTTDAVAGPFDVGGGYEGFWLQLAGVAGGGHYVVEASIDGATWTDITAALLNVGTDTEATSPLTANGLYAFQDVLPGQVRVRCTVNGTGTPAYVIAFQDSRTS